MISHEHRCIFIHIPKCGGQTVENLFLRDLGLDWDSRSPLLLGENIMSGGPPQLAHLRLSDLLQHHYISNDIFEKYTKFATVRNPYDRVASFYRYCGYSSVIPFRRFVLNELVNQVNNRGKRFYFFRPQFDYVENDKGRMGVDFFIKLEEFDETLGKALTDIGVRGVDIRRINSSKVPRSVAYRMARTVKRRVVKLREGCFSGQPFVDSSIVWSSDMREIVRQVYAKDFENFSYDM